MSQRKILLLEANYKNKYPPMGLMKIATYYRCRGDDVRFFKGNLKQFAAQLLVEEYIARMQPDVDNIDAIVHAFFVKRGQSVLIDFVKTGKHKHLEIIATFATKLDDADEQIFEKLLEKFSKYRRRFTNKDYPKFDRVHVTTLFTFYWKETIETIKFAKNLCACEAEVHVGGIAATLVPEQMQIETGIEPHRGLLDSPFVYDNDAKGNVIIDELPLDYSILDEIEYKYPTADAYFGYMTRGCVNRCEFCAVPTLEPQYCGYISIRQKLQKVETCFGAKRDLLLMDNNVFASNCFAQIVDEIKECGFAKGASYTPANEYDIAYRNLCDGFPLSSETGVYQFNDRAYFKKIIRIYDALADSLIVPSEKGDFYSEREKLGLLFSETSTKQSVISFHETAKRLFDKHFKQNKRVRHIDFNQGLDGRLAHVWKMEKIAELAIRPMRIAFDHWSMKEIYIESIEAAANYGIKDLSNYLLYNFKDHPDELYERLSLNVELCESLGVNIYSFPMKYHPIRDPEYFRNRDFIGTPHWNRKFIRAVQAVLNSTHGKIGRGKTFFQAAFGKDIEEFHKILWMPEALIVQRYKYDVEKRLEYYGDKETPYDNVDEEIGHTTANWWREFSALSQKQRELIDPIIMKHSFSDEDISTDDEQVAKVLRYYQIKRES